MAIKGYMESSLATSEIFKQINSIEGGENTNSKAINLINNAKRLTVNDIEAAYISVRQVSDSLTRAAIKAFDNESVVLIYNDIPALNVTKTLPFITYNMKSKGKYVTYVFMDNRYITTGRNGIMNLSAAVLRDLLISAVIANGIRKDYSKLASNATLRKILMEIYAKFVIRILNREFAIMADKVTLDKLQYWINKFFLLRVFGAMDNPENLDRIASEHVKYISEIDKEEMKFKYDDSDPSAISELLELLKTASPRMKGLNTAKFYSDWTNYYFIPSMLAIDVIEYLIFMVIALQSGNNIVSIAASDIVKECKGIKALREELLKLL